MPTGTFGGFPFDPEVYQSFVDQEATFSDSIIASGIVATDQSMADVLSNGGTVGTSRFYNPLDPETDAPLVRDGSNDNTPVATTGGKQSWIRIDRMKAWKTLQLTRELTGADPMAAVARSVGLYWRTYWQSLLVQVANTVTSLSALSSHNYVATSGTGMLDAGTLIYAQQAALGDMANKFGMVVMHSRVYAAYQKLGLVEMNKYTITNVLQREVELPSINGLIVVVNDRGTTHSEKGSGDTTTTYYDSFIFGQGSILTAQPRVITPDYQQYDPKTGGGTDVLYTNRSIILHPNGVSFKAANIAGETPTDAEFIKAANWEVKYQPKNVRIGKFSLTESQVEV